MELDDYTTAYPGLSATRDYLPQLAERIIRDALLYMHDSRPLFSNLARDKTGIR